jgi:hypothetical protein
MAEPPFEEGAVQVSETCASPAVALSAVGALEVVADGERGRPDPATYVNWSAVTALDVPVVLVTSMSTGVPVTVPDGEVMVSEVSDETVMLVPAFAPNFTPVADPKPVPVTVTTVPPLALPLLGLTMVTVGVVSYVKWSAVTALDVPVVLVTSMSTGVPVTVPDGESMVSEVSDETVMPVPAVAPNFTPVAERKPVPVTVTTVPPLAFPPFGLT